jgi:adenylate kinase family enzyme
VPLIGRTDENCIQVMAASGSGASSLGRALAETIAQPHHDADDYLWLPTVPTYRTLREVADFCAALG